jgi:hypothetical protein
MPAPAAAAAAPAAEPARAPLRRLRPVLRPVKRVRPRRRVQPPLRRLRAAWVAHEPRAMIDSQCKVHTAICVQYRVGSPGWIRQKNTDIKENEIRYQSTNDSISYKDIEGAFVDIEISSISRYLRYRDIFDIGIKRRYRSSELRYRRFFDIVLRRYQSSRPRYRRFFDIVLVRYRKL